MHRNVKQKFFLLFSLICLNFSCYSQAWLWAKNATGGQYGTGGAIGNGVCSDPSGNAFVTGTFFTTSITFGSITLTNPAANTVTDAVYIVKYDPSGNVLWAKSGLGGGGIDKQGISVCTDLSGNVFMAGIYEGVTLSFGTVVLSSTGMENGFVVKYDPNGNVLWAQNIGGTGGGGSAAGAYSVSADQSGNTFVTGYFAVPSISFGSSVLTNVDPTGNSNDIFLAKYDPNGNVLWAKSAGGVNGDVILTSCVDPGGNVFVGGFFSSPTISFGSTTLTNTVATGSSNDMLLAKYDTNGNLIWVKAAGGTGDEVINSLSSDRNGNIFATGSYNSTTLALGSVVLNNVGGSDVFVFKSDPNGNIGWATGAGGADADYGYSISTDQRGNIFAMGLIGSPAITFQSTTLTPPPGSQYPVFIVKYNPSGQLLCSSFLTSGGANNERGFSDGICNDPFGNLYITGGYNASVNQPPFVIGSQTMLYPAGENEFLAKYTCNNFLLNVTQSNPLCNSQCNGSATSAPSNGIAPYTYSWSTTPVQTSSTATGLCPGSYTVTVTDSIGYIETQVVTLTSQLPGPPANAGSDVTILAGQTTTLNATGGGSYSWSPTTGLSCDTCSSPNANPLRTTTYCVLEKDSLGCTNSSCVEVKVDCGDIFIPNYFSPNGDGKNESECVYGPCIKTLSFTIYDRWGEKVFETADPKHCWDGKFRGVVMNTGVFVYYFQATLITGDVVTRKGNITLGE
jgi:gliding motility-associated-like protein